jgi:hypothetical protein
MRIRGHVTGIRPDFCFTDGTFTAISGNVPWHRFSYADAGQMHLYLNYAREHWMKSGENPPVGLILCAEKGAAEAHYALDNLPNKVLAAEYQTILPNEKLIANELEKSREELEARKRLSSDMTQRSNQ